MFLIFFRIITANLLIYSLAFRAQSQTNPLLDINPRKDLSKVAPISPWIQGGSPVTPEDKRFNSVFALLLIDLKTKLARGLCTASQIQDGVLLTAAHCFDDIIEETQAFNSNESKSVSKNQPDLANSRFGVLVVFTKSLFTLNLEEYLTSTEAIEHSVWAKKVLIHPQYNKYITKYKNTYDLALLRYQAPKGNIKFPKSKVVPVLPEKLGVFLNKGSPILIAGYGENDGEQGANLGVLYSVETKIFNPEFSTTEMNIWQFRRGFCSGDSGGPAFLQLGDYRFVAGVVSRGFKIWPFGCIFSGILIRPDKLTEWIQLSLKEI